MGQGDGFVTLNQGKMGACETDKKWGERKSSLMESLQIGEQSGRGAVRQVEMVRLEVAARL